MIPCDFGGRRLPFPIYAGEPVLDAHPLEQQAAWLERERGGTVPAEVMESFAKLRVIAADNDVDFGELTAYAMNEALSQQSEADGADSAEAPGPG
ncbi:DUF2610 domain-containing protein [Catellatospora coxensis]|uniref:Uncharacterized protein n=2 Tax=Catellatospora coxensis TaxID=310354 RepID=A0A8J3KVZ2_9ACTN|nr:hypothetical protein Cco03nite_29540 [Catellatospora coxensis]